MTLDQFVIIPDNPSMIYLAGQVVSGKVVVKSSVEEKTQGILLTFQGYAWVQWTEHVTETTGIGDDKHEEEVSHNHDHSERYFEVQSYLLGDGKSDVFIQPGETSYPFSFQLPATNIPCSYVGTHGQVEYILEANVKRSWKFDYHAKQIISVIANVDLNNIPEASQPGNWKASRKKICCLCCASGPLSVNIRTSTVGYCPGEIATLEIEVNNPSTKKITDISAALIQEVTYSGFGDWRIERSPLFFTKRDHSVQAGDSDIWRPEIQIPVVPPTKLGGCNIIVVEYIIEVTVHASGMALNLGQRCPIIVGTMPLRSMH